MVPVLIVSTAVGVGLVKLPYGMFWPDEGFYLTSSYRLLLGDRPFRDELSYASSWFFLILTPILALLPDGGTIIQVRLVGYAIRLVAAALLFWRFRDALPASLLAAGLAVTLLANYPSLFIPNYNSLPFDLGYLALTAWLSGLRSGSPTAARAWGAAAGALFALSCLCYLPRLPLAAVPAAALGWALRRGHAPLLVSSRALLAAATAVFGAALLWLVLAGLASWVVDGIRFQAASPLFSPDPVRRLSWLWRVESQRAVPGALVQLAFWAAGLMLGRLLGRGRSPWAVGGLAGLTVAYALVVAGTYVRAGDRSVPAYTFVYAGLCGSSVLAYALARRRLAAYPPDVTIAAALVFWFGAGQQAVATLTSTQLTAAAIPGLATSLLLLLLLWEAPEAEATGGLLRASRLPAFALCLVLGATAAVFHFYPEQNPLRVRTAAFDRGRLAGLRTNRRSVRGWTGIVDYLRPRVQRGEFVLAYGNIPLLHYLTDTRPALRASYVAGFMYDGAQQGLLVEAMRRDGRVPRYAVRLLPAPPDEYVAPSYSERPEKDPVNAFVREHFEREAVVPPFEVFRRREP